MKTILLDTSILVESAKNNIDIQRELERILDTSFTIAILDRTMEELNTIQTRGKKEGSYAKLAKTILLTKHVTLLPTSGGHTDTLLLEKANEKYIIATTDKTLKQKLKKKGQNVIVIRGQKRLALEEA